jgi:hypothetical protein
MSLLGMTVVIEQPRLRYTLPTDVPPGTGCTREEFAEWSARVCGFQKPLLANGEVFQLGDGTLYMNAATAEYVSKLVAHNIKESP